MTEAEWLAEDDPFPRQLATIHQVATVRKLLLIAAAYVRGAQARPEHADAKRCDDLIEAVADRLLPSDQIALELAARPGHWGFTHVVAVPQDPATVARALRNIVATYRAEGFGPVKDFVRLMHDVVGNPFRQMVADPSWLTSTVTALSRQVYDSRDFSILPILADALQDAGCDNDDVLDHCRADRPHVRGCWVVDLLLGKE